MDDVNSVPSTYSAAAGVRNVRLVARRFVAQSIEPLDRVQVALLARGRCRGQIPTSRLTPRRSRAKASQHRARPGQVLAHYHPAGPDWRAAIRTDQARALVETEIETPEPEALARHWGSILELPVGGGGRDPTIALAQGAIRFVKTADARTECLGGLRIEVADVDRACATAATRGYRIDGNSFHLAGVHFRLQPAG